LTVSPRSLHAFGWVWVGLSLIVIPITLLQVIEAFPLLTVAEERLHMRRTESGLIRGVGFKSDPNFQAMVLVVGVVYSQFVVKNLFFRWVVVGVLSLGVLGTMSRMGVLAVLIAVSVPPVFRSMAGRSGYLKAVWRSLLSLVIVVAVLFGLYLRG